MSEEMMSVADHQAKMKSIRENLTAQIKGLRGDLSAAQEQMKANEADLASVADLRSQLAAAHENDAFRAADIDPSGLHDRHRGYVRALLSEMKVENPEATMADLFASEMATTDPLLRGLSAAPPAATPPAGTPANGTPPATPPRPAVQASPFARQQTPPPPPPADKAMGAMQMFNQNAAAGMGLAENNAAVEKAFGAA